MFNMCLNKNLTILDHRCPKANEILGLLTIYACFCLLVIMPLLANNDLILTRNQRDDVCDFFFETRTHHRFVKT